jgi:AraC-like DNA-binding protein
MDMEKYIDVADVDPLGKLSPEDAAAIAATFQLERYGPGESLVQFQHKIEYVGLVLSGLADVYAGGLPYDSLPCGYVGPGDFFGDFGCLTDRASMVTIICRETVVARLQAYDDFRFCIETYDIFKQYFLTSAVKKIRTLYKALGSIGVATGDGLPGVPRTIAKALTYIDTKLDHTLSLDEVSKEAGMSRFAFSRNFKRYTGLSFKDHINRCRVKKAKQLMVSDGLNVTEACFAVGFNDVSYFSRVFRKIDGCSPSEFRRVSFDCRNDKATH